MAESLCDTPTMGSFPDREGSDMATQPVQFPRSGCKCGRPECEETAPMALWRDQGGVNTFLGAVQLMDGVFRKLDDPRDLDSAGHTMSVLEFMTESNHCDGAGRALLDSYDARDIAPYLVDYRGHPPPQDEDDYPFHEGLEPPYKDSPPPKVRAWDVVRVVTEADLKVSDKLTVPPDQDIHIRVISLTSGGMLTGNIETNFGLYMVYFPVHHVRKLVIRGKTWEKCINCNNGLGDGWYNCPNNLSTRGGTNDCVSECHAKFCVDCGPDDIKSKCRELWRDEGASAAAAVSDTEHQKGMMMMYCGGFDRGSCMATKNVREPLVECRACATSGERKLRSCFACGKIRCITCIGYAADQGGAMLGVAENQWSMLSERFPSGMDDTMKSAFVADCIKRCGDCGQDFCMQCVSERTLASNLSKGRLFDCKDSGCRCVNCMARERIEGKVNEKDTAFKCDDCRKANKKCHNPECANPPSKTCARCGKAKYCSKECQVTMWPRHKTVCKKKATEGEAKRRGEKIMKKREAKGIISDVMSAHKKQPW